MRISFERGKDPVEGTLHGGGRPPRRFIGWLELNSLLVGVVGGSASAEAGIEPGRLDAQ